MRKDSTMFAIKNFLDNDDIKKIAESGAFTVIEYQRDLSVTQMEAQQAYFASQMNVRKRQVLCDLRKSNVTTQSGAMQWMVGNVNATTGIKGVGDLFGKALRGSVTGESAIKPTPLHQTGVPGAEMLPVPPSIRVFSNESTLLMRWPKYF